MRTLIALAVIIAALPVAADSDDFTKIPQEHESYYHYYLNGAVPTRSEHPDIPDSAQTPPAYFTEIPGEHIDLPDACFVPHPPDYCRSIYEHNLAITSGHPNSAQTPPEAFSHCNPCGGAYQDVEPAPSSSERGKQAWGTAIPADGNGHIDFWPYGMTKEEFGAFIEEHVRKALEQGSAPK